LHFECKIRIEFSKIQKTIQVRQFQNIFRLGRIMIERLTASWFETRDDAALLTMRIWRTSRNAVSKDVARAAAHPSRLAALAPSATTAKPLRRDDGFRANLGCVSAISRRDAPEFCCERPAR
jgi:hypothetical protein